MIGAGFLSTTEEVFVGTVFSRFLKLGESNFESSNVWSKQVFNV